MGKKYCNICRKWCKFLRHGVCTFENVGVDTLTRCKRLTDIETTRLATLLREVNFDVVFSILHDMFGENEEQRDGYLAAFNNLCTMRPKKHYLNDLFIKIERLDGEIYVSAVNVFRNGHRKYGIELMKWKNLISMFITNDTLNNFTKEEIVAGCLYEMTFYGFEESKVNEARERTEAAFREFRERQANAAG